MLKNALVSDIMSRHVVTLSEEDNLSALAESETIFSFRQFPVLDGDKYVGVLTHRSLLRVTLQGESPTLAQDGDTFVAAAVQRDAPTIGPNETAARAAQMLLNRRVLGLPVVDSDGKLVGMVTRTDILRLAIDLLGKNETATPR